MPHPKTQAVWLFCNKRVNDKTAQDKTQRFSSRRGKLDSPEASLPQNTASSNTGVKPEYFFPKQAISIRHRQRQQDKLQLYKQYYAKLGEDGLQEVSTERVSSFQEARTGSAGSCQSHCSPVSICPFHRKDQFSARRVQRRPILWCRLPEP